MSIDTSKDSSLTYSYSIASGFCYRSVLTIPFPGFISVSLFGPVHKSTGTSREMEVRREGRQSEKDFKVGGQCSRLVGNSVGNRPARRSGAVVVYGGRDHSRGVEVGEIGGRGSRGEEGARMTRRRGHPVDGLADLYRQIDLRYESSLLNWWPKVAELDVVPVPRTEIVRFRQRTLRAFAYPSTPGAHNIVRRAVLRYKSVALAMGFPLFLRTDQTSGKHSYKGTCFVARPEDLLANVTRLIECNESEGMAGLPYKALVFREYLPLASRFTAFHGDLPIAPERRYFVRDGAVQCHHPYWPSEALSEGYHPKPLPHDWRLQLAEMNEETPGEVALLSSYAARVAEVIPGYWSVDFALAASGIWYLLDMARGETSWHPGCVFAPKETSQPEVDLPDTDDDVILYDTEPSSTRRGVG